MLTIRLTRKGKKNQPFFRLVVVDKRKSSKAGAFVEDLGYKNPLTKKISINKDRVLYWISKGAQPSSSVHNLLISQKIINEKKIKITNISKKKKAEMAAAAQTVSVPVEKPVEASVEKPVAPEGEAKPAA
jgi:small subunit ribosomal protein S16